MSDAADLSALVVLRPRGGQTLTGGQAITSESIADMLPDPAAVERTEAFFRSRGFAVSEPVGLSFSITAPRSRFEETFGAGAELDVAERAASGDPEAGGAELDLGRLPDDVSAAVEAVAFPSPPDFGPTAP